MKKSFEQRVLAYRFPIIALTLVVTVLASLGFQHVNIVGTYKIFFEKDDPSLIAFEALEDTYTKTDRLLLIMTPKTGDIYQKDFLDAVIDLTAQTWLLPYVTRVDSLSNFQYTEAQEDDLIVGDLVENPQNYNDDDLSRIRSIVAKEPVLLNRLVAANGQVTGISTTMHFPPEELHEDQTFGERWTMTLDRFTNDAHEDKEKLIPLQYFIAKMREMIAKAEQKYPNIEFRTTGTVVLNNAFSEASMIDATTLLPISFLVIIIGLFLFIRSFFATIAALCVVFLSILIALGSAAWYGVHFSPPVVQTPLIILTLAVADSLHVLTTFFHEMRNGADKRTAIKESLRINLMPVLLTSVTTIIGFLTLNFSDSPPFHALGNVVAVGVAAAFFLSVFLLPALLSIFPVKVKQAESFEARLMESLGQFVIDNSRKLFYASGAVIIFCIAFLPQNELDDVWSDYFDESLDVRQHTQYTRENLTGINTIQFSMPAGEENGINEPLYLANLEAFANWFKQQPSVLHVQTFTDTMKRLNKDMHGGEWEKYTVPEDRELAAQYLLLYEMSLPQGLDLNDQINMDKSATRLVVSVDEMSTRDMLDLEQEARRWMQESMPQFAMVRGTSSDMMFAEMGQRNIISMLEGTSVALIIISVVLLFALKSVKFGLISLIPNIAPAAMGFGIWGLFIGQVGLGLSVVAGMTLGIVVDDTVHFLSKYLRARREKGLSRPEAVKYSFETVGVALAATTIILCFGFGVLAFSAFKLNSTMGLLTSITIGLALIVDFLFLPPLLLQFDRTKRTSAS